MNINFKIRINWSLHIFLYCSLLLLFQGSALNGQVTSQNVFLAGAATSNITPKIGTSINGNFRDVKVLNIHDETHARSIVLDDGNIYSGVCWSETRDGKKWVPNTGFVTILDNSNMVVSNPGGEPPVYVNGELQKMYQAEPAIFNHGHDVFVDEDKNLYVCQWNAHYTPPIKLERV